jgi:RNA polymerase sigma factor (sigma-70 family)
LSEKPLHSVEFTKAVLSNDKNIIEDYSGRIVPKVMEYLMITLNANRFHAEECAHQAFSIVLERINNRLIDDSASIVSYMITTARNEYFKMLKSEIREGAAILQEQYYQDTEEQLEALLDAERTQVLAKCFDNLETKSRDFIEYVIRHPEYSMLKVGKIFNISPENARTRKSRIISQLSDCVSRKLNR